MLLHQLVVEVLAQVVLLWHHLGLRLNLLRLSVLGLLLLSDSLLLSLWIKTELIYRIVEMR